MSTPNSGPQRGHEPESPPHTGPAAAASPPPAVPAFVPPPGGTLAGHPRGLFVLFFAELWERFSFYGMRALLVLYMVFGLEYDEAFSKGTYGAYLGFVYFTPLIGGMLADRFLGYRRAIVLGGMLMVAGHFAMAVEHPVFFYGALALIVAGNGFFKPNISTLVGKLYAPDDARRDGAFTIFYMGINIGALTAPLACGYLGEKIGWHWGFTLAGVGMVIGQLVFMSFTRYLGEHGKPPRPEAFKEKIGGVLPKPWLLYLGVLIFVPLAALLLRRPSFVETGIFVVGAFFLLYMLYEAFRCEKVARDRLLVAIVLALFSIVFWACFEQAGSSLNLFAEQETDRYIGDFLVPASWFQSVNPTFIVIFAIPFAAMWSYLERIGKSPTAPVKFALGLFQLALGFYVLVFAAQEAQTDGKAAMWWLIVGYLLHTTGELCVSPVGLSNMTKLAPARLTGLMMGFWFLCAAFAGVTSGIIAKMTDAEGGYAAVFEGVVYFAAGAGVVLLLLSPLLKRMMHGIR